MIGGRSLCHSRVNGAFCWLRCSRLLSNCAKGEDEVVVLAGALAGINESRKPLARLTSGAMIMPICKQLEDHQATPSVYGLTPARPSVFCQMAKFQRSGELV
jgi:hypothetical protein